MRHMTTKRVVSFSEWVARPRPGIKLVRAKKNSEFVNFARMFAASYLYYLYSLNNAILSTIYKSREMKLNQR